VLNGSNWSVKCLPMTQPASTCTIKKLHSVRHVQPAPCLAASTACAPSGCSVQWHTPARVNNLNPKGTGPSPMICGVSSQPKQAARQTAQPVAKWQLVPLP
jgi:hypothetical protein